MDDKLKELKGYYEDRHICPYATIASRRNEILHISLTEVTRDSVFGAVKQFLTIPILRNQAAVILPPEVKTYQEAFEVSWEIYEYLIYSFLVVSNTGHTDSYLRTFSKSEMITTRSRKHKVRAFPTYKSKFDAMPIVFGPWYGANHPRYAPHFLITIVWHVDISKKMDDDPAVIERIRTRGAHMLGLEKPYDADEFIMPLPPKKKKH